MDFAGRIHNKLRGKRVCGRFRSKHAHGQQERPEQSRNGDREDIEKSDGGGDSQRRSASKRKGNGVLPRIGLIRDGNAFIDTDNSLEFGKDCEELSWYHCTSTPIGLGRMVLLTKRISKVRSVVLL